MKRSAIKKVLAGLSSACMIATAIPFTAAQAAEKKQNYGDANCDGEVNMSDAVMIMQACLNPSKYDVTGTDNDRITVEGKLNGDVDGKDGINLTDALLIQQYSLKLIDKLPIEENVDPVTDNVKIILSGSSITVEGDTNGYTAVEGTTLTISHSGSYYIEGTLDDGQICVNIPDEAADPDTVKLFLNGASITGKSAPAILVSNSENTSVNIVDGTENTLSDGDTAYVDAAGTPTNDAVIEAKDDITIKGGELGTGVLSITANTQKAVSCNNDIKINGGVVNIKTLNSTDKTDAVAAKKSVTVKSGTLTIDAEGDGIKSSKDAVSITGGTVSIKAGNDAVQAETSIDISGGEIIAGGDRGFTAASVNITGGKVIATATDIQAAAVTAENQAVILLNCIDDAENTKDGMWKKVNTLVVSTMKGKLDFTKKYKYVLMSDPSMKVGDQVSVENVNYKSTAVHNVGETSESYRFMLTESVNTFNNVDPVGYLPVPDIQPEEKDTYTLEFGSELKSDAPADTATVSNGTVTITKPGKFTVTGSSATAQITVDVDKTAYPEGKVELVLNDVQLANLKTAPIYVASIGDEVQITAKAGTVNTISDGTSHTQTYTDSDGNVNTVEGAVFARDDIKFKGSGILEISGNTDDAIVCKNDIKIYNGNITVTAVDDGIRAKDSVTIGDDVKSDGTAADNSGLKLTVKTTQGDGIKATSTDTSADKSYGAVTVNGGTIDINSYGDGIQAEQEFIMNGGDLNIYTCTGSTYTASGSSSGSQGGNSNKTDVSAKGIKAVGLYDAAGTTWQSKGNITINGGNITVDSSDDCIHCSGDAVLNAGKLKLASADDAVHSDASLYIGGKTAGTDYTSLEVYVTACYEGMEAVYIYQNNGNIYIVSRDDGYNSAGGADSSGNNNNTGFNQGGFGGFPGGGGMSSKYGEMHLNGGIVSVNTSFNDADGFDSNGPVIFNGGYYFGNGGDSFDSGDGYSITYNGGYALGGLGMNGGKGYDMSTQMVFAASDGTVLASSKTGSRLTYAYGDSNVTAYSNAEVTGGTNISTLGQPAVYVSGKVSGGTAMTRGQGSSTQPGRPGFGG